MNILVDIGHPAHVHVFRHFRDEMIGAGHTVHFTTRDKECAIQLLEHYNIPYTNLGKPYKGAIRKLFGMLLFTKRVYRIAKKNNIDLFISISSMYAAQAAWLMGKPHIVLDDTEHSKFEHALYKPFSKVILTPSCFQKHMGNKQVRYDGFHELAYLHPNRFKPDNSIREKLGVGPEDRFVILRFVAWNAGHDAKANGLSNKLKSDLVAELGMYGRVFISSEGELPEELEQYRMRIQAHDMHEALNECDLYIGEGATMASECAMLGTPAIYVNTLNAGTLREQSSYGLIHHFMNGDGVLEEALLILQSPDSKRSYGRRSKLMLDHKIDVTKMLVDLSMTYGKSLKNPLPVRLTNLNVAQ